MGGNGGFSLQNPIPLHPLVEFGLPWFDEHGFCGGEVGFVIVFGDLFLVHHRLSQSALAVIPFYSASSNLSTPVPLPHTTPSIPPP